MATVRWLGTRANRAQIDTLTVSNSTAATVYTVTHQSGDAVIVPAIASGLTVDQVASLISDAISAYGGVFSELTPQTLGGGTGSLTITGPEDGAPFTITTTTSPGSRATSSTTTTPKSSADAADVLNYSTGALPSAGDTLVYENSANGVKYGLTGLAAIALAKVIRKSTFTGQFGLPDVSVNGYNEFRAVEMQFDTAILECEANGTDQVGQFRIQFLNTAVTATINGSGAQPPALGSEPFWLRGSPVASTLAVVGSGAWICPKITDASTFATVTAYGSTVRIGSSATITTLKFVNSSGDMGCAGTTVTLDRGGTLRLYGSGAYTTINCEEGTLYYQSSGTITTLNIGSGGIFNATLAAAAFTVTTINCKGDGITLLDPTRRINTGMSIVLQSTDLSKCNFDFGTGGTFSFSA